MDTNVPVRIISEMERCKSRYHSRSIAANVSFPKAVCRIRDSIVYLYDSGQLARDLMDECSNGNFVHGCAQEAY
jgi:hypothetical protein